MWLLLAQQDIAEVLKDAKVLDAIKGVKETHDLNTYLVYTLFALAGGAFAYLLAAIKDKEKGKDAAIDKMVTIMETMLKRSDQIHEKQASEHQLDRDAFLVSAGEIKNAVVEVSKAQTAIVHELTVIKEEFRRSGDRKIP